MKLQIAIVLSFISMAVSVSTQSADWRAHIWQKVQEIYGDQAPSRITFITVPADQLAGLGAEGPSVYGTPRRTGTLGTPPTSTDATGTMGATGIDKKERAGSAGGGTTPAMGSAGADSGTRATIGEARGRGAEGMVQTRATQPGDSATGVVLDEKGNQAAVDASPCSGKVMVFTKPYAKSPAESVTCGDKTFDRFRFVQK